VEVVVVDHFDQVLFWAQLTAALLVGFHVVQISVVGLRALRAGQPGLKVGVAVTTAVIGLGLALGGSWIGSVAAFHVSSPFGFSWLAVFLMQIAGALAASWMTAAAYARWLAPVVLNWFSREGATRGG
jgi:hypothetical protein